MRPSEEVEMIKSMFPTGTKIRLLSMDDLQPIAYDTIGIVNFVDDDGQLHMKWDNGRTLALIYGVDKFEKVED